MKVTVGGEHRPNHPHPLGDDTDAMLVTEAQPTPLPPLEPETHEAAPIGTLMVIAVLLLATLGMWMLILGIQQGRA